MAWAVDHVDIGDLESLALHQRRQETMQAVEIRQRQKHVAAKRLQAAPGVTGAVVKDGAADPIGDPRLEFLETGVLAADALASDETDALAATLQCRDQVAQKNRVVLPVAVECRHQGAARKAHAGPHRRRLSRRARVGDLAQHRVARHQGLEPLGGGIARAVIDVNDLVAPAPIQRGHDLAHQRRNIVRFVAHRDDDRHGWNHSAGIGRHGVRSFHQSAAAGFMTARREAAFNCRKSAVFSKTPLQACAVPRNRRGGRGPCATLLMRPGAGRQPL